MMRVNWVACCAVLALVVAFSPTIAIADDNPFGGEGVDLTQLVPAEPTPELAIDPAPADEDSMLGNPATPAAPQDFCRCIGDDTSASAVVNIRKALRQPLKDAGMEFTDQALEQVVGLLQDEYVIPIKLDTAALDDLGVQPDKPVTVNLHGISLRAALRLMLKQLGLTYIIQDEVLMITTPDEAVKQLETCVYDVRDLIQDAKKGNDFDTLIDSITSCVSTETWSENGGGEAEIRPLQPGLLIVAQTQVVHDQIRGLLDAIRQTKAQHQLDAGTAAAAAIAQPHVAAAGGTKVVTRSYFLQINQPADGDSFASQIRDLITMSLPDEQWAGRLDNGEPVVLTVLPDRIVLRHRESVQDKVKSLLKESAVAYPASAVAGGGGGGFGGGGMGGGGGGFFNPQPAENR